MGGHFRYTNTGKRWHKLVMMTDLVNGENHQQKTLSDPAHCDQLSQLQKLPIVFLVQYKINRQGKEREEVQNGYPKQLYPPERPPMPYRPCLMFTPGSSDPPSQVITKMIHLNWTSFHLQGNQRNMWVGIFALHGARSIVDIRTQVKEQICRPSII